MSKYDTDLYVTIGDDDNKGKRNSSPLSIFILALICFLLFAKNPEINLNDIIDSALETLLGDEGNNLIEDKAEKNEEELPVMWTLSSDLSIATRTYTDSEGKTSQVQYEFSENARSWYKKFIENYPDANQMERNMTIAALSTLDKGITYDMNQRYQGVTLDLENNKIWDCSSWYFEVIYLATGENIIGTDGRVTGTVIEKGDTNIIKKIEDARPSDALLKNTQATGGGNHVVFFLGIFDGKVYVIHCSSDNKGVAVDDFTEERLSKYPIMVRMNVMTEYLNSIKSKGQSTSMSNDDSLQSRIAQVIREYEQTL